jgi:hypothetical protein
MVDIIYRDFELTADQAVAYYGAENLSAQTNKLALDKPDTLVRFCHAIYPRKGGKRGAVISRAMPFESCHVEVKACKLVKESGYHEFPVIVPRWHRLPQSVYAVGPTYDALPDIRMLNELKRMEFMAADIAVSGMWIAEDDGVLNPRTIKVGPRKVIVANSVDSMKALESGADFNVSFTIAKDLKDSIRRVFMADQLEPADGPARTATEVHVRVGLIRQMLGPVYGRLQSEWLAPMVGRCFGIAARSGVLGKPPDSLNQRVFQVRYISPLARAQRQEEVAAMDQFETVLGQQSLIDPTAADVYDFDNANRERSKLLGVPLKLLRTEDEVLALRKQRQDAAAQAQQAQALQAGADSFATHAGQRLATQ